jgi:hypothetical protein
MDRPTISILTDPIPFADELLHEGLRRFYRFFRAVFKLNLDYFKHGLHRGHVGVTRSLLTGMKQANVIVNYNPLTLGSLADTVIVLAGVRTLRQAIKLKEKGRIKRLYVGPNVVVFSSDSDSILAHPEVDAAITPSDWVVDLYLEDNPSLKSRIFSWPAGVDTSYWKPRLGSSRNSILIFEKQNKGPVGPIEPYVKYLRELDWKVQIIKYGSYTHDQYLNYLQESCLMLGFVVCESQGLAWAEAWSADVPTLILKRTTNIFQGREYKNSSAPYLHPENGLFFDDFEDFKNKFQYWESHREQFTPREWVVKNMSDEVCASKILRIIEEYK